MGKRGKEQLLALQNTEELSHQLFCIIPLTKELFFLYYLCSYSALEILKPYVLWWRTGIISGSKELAQISLPRELFS